MDNENRKKREWVKTAAIVFLSVMLVLTFFSNTIMNYSLPEAATQMVRSGTISSKIRGTGVVESGELYNVEVTESRKVASVAVKEGQQVAQGDVILYLEDQESEELQAAIEMLESLQAEYDRELLSGTVDLSTAERVEKGKVISVEEYQKQLAAAQEAYAAASKKAEETGAWVKAIEDQISMSSQVAVDISAEEKAFNEAQLAYNNIALEVENRELTLHRAQEAVDAALARQEAAQNAYDGVVSGGDADTVTAARQRLEEANKKVAQALTSRDAAQQSVNEGQAALDVRKKAMNAAQVVLNTARTNAENAQVESNAIVENLNKQLATARYNHSVAETAVQEKREALDELIAKIGLEMNLTQKIEAIRKQEDVVAKLREKSIGATVTAAVNGTVTSINVIPGQSTMPGTPVAVIQPAGKGFTLSFSVTNEQAKRVSVGDPAELVNSWWYSDLTAKVISIRPDPSNPSKQKQLTFELTGDLMAGQSLNLSVGAKSANYDLIVPNSAIREDNNGKFVLIVEQKSSPLGNRYQATRVDVEVLATDDTQSAVRGALEGWENVITTSTKPIEAGQLIRLPD